MSEAITKAAEQPFTPAQRMRLWQNTEKGKSATSLGAFERICQAVEAAHRIGQESPQPAVPVVSDEQIDPLVQKHARATWSGSQQDWDVAEFSRLGLIMFANAIANMRPAVEPMTGGAWLATRLWNSRYEWTCPADIASMLASPEEAHMPEATTGAASDVLAERQRQINVEWYTPGHDSEHGDGSLARAAACYAMGKQTVRAFEGAPDVILWPWENASWKPTTHRRNLIKAGALILAEIERLDRANGITAKAEGGA